MARTHKLVGSFSDTQSLLGGLSDSNALIENNFEILDAVMNPYVPPHATTEALGGMLVGENLIIDENGVLSVIDGWALSTTAAHLIDCVNSSGHTLI